MLDGLKNYSLSWKPYASIHDCLAIFPGVFNF